MNQSARAQRHQRVFGSAVLSRFSRMSPIKVPGKALRLRSVFIPHFYGHQKEVDALSASNLLFKKYVSAVAVLFLITSISTLPVSAEEMYASQLLATPSLSSSILTDGEGYLTKMNPQTSMGDRSSMNDRLIHTVASGETLGAIAEGYGLKTQTVLWENGLSNANSLRTGQQLSIPPVDGISHTVAKGETLESIAKKYSVDAEAVRKQNTLLADVNVGDRLFVPGATPLAEDIRITPARVGTMSRVTSVAVGSHTDFANSSDTPIAGKSLIFPTRGKITQGFKRGHYAFDIADSSKPPIWAAGSGKVVKASSGTWGGGYGNHIIIDHGNGVQTLYAHMDYLDVSEGDVVDQGQVLGRMGRTGRVYGVTGIHLHFEVIQDGVKQVPSNFY